MTPRESRKQRSALWRDFHIDFPGEWNIASRSSIPPWVLKPLPYCFGKSILYPPWMQAEIESGRLAQGGFAANTTLVVRRWFGCGFAAPWGRPSFLVVCLWQGRVEKTAHHRIRVVLQSWLAVFHEIFVGCRPSTADDENRSSAPRSLPLHASRAAAFEQRLHIVHGSPVE